MLRREYSAENNLQELYYHIDTQTKDKIATSKFEVGVDDPTIEDVVLRAHGGLVLRGTSTMHGIIYHWQSGERWIEANCLPGKWWIEAKFKPDIGSAVTQEQKQRFVQALIEHFGEPNRREGRYLYYCLDVYEIDPKGVGLRINLDAYVHVPGMCEQLRTKLSFFRRLLPCVGY